MKLRFAILGVGLVVGGLFLVSTQRKPRNAGPLPPPERIGYATFAGGCFWCMEGPFDALPGVLSTTSGYAGGKVKSPTYEEVSSGRTGHAECLRVAFDNAKVTYEQLLDVYWHNVDPFDRDGQFCDRGTQYRTAIFYESEDQQRAAQASKRNLEASGRSRQPVVTEIVRLEAFYPAEDYHQDYYERNPLHYKMYRSACGRDRRLEQLWGSSHEQ